MIPKKGADGKPEEGKTDKKLDHLAGGYDQTSSSETTSKTSAISGGGSVTIKGKDDVTLQGSSVKSDGNVDINSQEAQVKLTKTEDSSESSGFGVGYAGKNIAKVGSNSGGFSTGVNVQNKSDDTGQGVTIQSGGQTTVSGKGGVVDESETGSLIEEARKALDGFAEALLQFDNDLGGNRVP